MAHHTRAQFAHLHTKLQHHLDEHRPPLLVLDALEESLAFLAGEKERKLRQFWAGLVALARQHGTAVLVLARQQGRVGDVAQHPAPAPHEEVISDP